MDSLKKWWKNLTMFEKVSSIIIPILVLIIIITAIVIANKNDALQELKRKNDEITQTTQITQVFNHSQTKEQKLILYIYNI